MEGAHAVDGFIQVDEEISIRDVSMQGEYCDDLLPLRSWDESTSSEAEYRLFSEKQFPVRSKCDQNLGGFLSSDTNTSYTGNQEIWYQTCERNGGGSQDDGLNATPKVSSTVNVNLKELPTTSNDDITNKTLLKSLKKYSKSSKQGGTLGSRFCSPIKTYSATSSKGVQLGVNQESSMPKQDAVPSTLHNALTSQVAVTATMCSSSSASLINTSKSNDTCSSPHKDLKEEIAEGGGVPSPSEGEIAPQSAGSDIFLSGVISKIQKKMVQGPNCLSWLPNSGNQVSDRLSLSALKDNIRQKISTPTKGVTSSVPVSNEPGDIALSTSCPMTTAIKEELETMGNKKTLIKENPSKKILRSGSIRQKRGSRRDELSILYDALREIKWVQKMSLKKLIASKQTPRHRTPSKKPEVVIKGKKSALVTSKDGKVTSKKQVKSYTSAAAQTKNGSVQLKGVSTGKKVNGSESVTVSKEGSKSAKKGAKAKGSSQEQKAAGHKMISVENIKVEPCDVSTDRKHDAASAQSLQNAATSAPVKHNVIQKIQNGLLQHVSPCGAVVLTVPQLTQLKEQSHMTTVLREVHSTPSSSEDEAQRTSKKRKADDDSLRSSIRQSECAFRYKEIVVKKHQNYTHIVILPNESKLNSLTLQTLQELKEAITSARKDASCRVLLLSSSGKCFCSGIDLSILVGPDKQQVVHQLSSAIRSFVETLSTFPKPVVAAVNGIAIGLGVILLTYCDVVFASDKATFCTPYCRYGYVPEGAGTITLPQVVGATIASDMLLRGRRLTALEAHTFGLVSEVFWPTKVMEEVTPRVQAMAEQSSRAMEVTKALLRCHLWEKVKVTLDNEVHILPKQWLSQSCQNSMKAELELSRKSS